MNIREKIKMDRQGLEENGPITIVAFGDSVTHGAVANNEINYETVYWRRLAQKLNAYRNYIPVNVINAGIGGITAMGSLGRMDKQVFAHDPDLVIVCFGLNDVNGTLDNYLGALRQIFERCIQANVETVFMTPNMLNTYVSDVVAPVHLNYAAVTAKYQNEGRMDEYMSAACRLAEEMGIKVCDCYSYWKKLSKTEDTTRLLANGINHPTNEMHELFAQMLYNTVMETEEDITFTPESTMYEKN
ncbi:MAG: SGNH/GDSL hydrolase family protein [Clostridia bacterium]|nr:SGNH/GDSL hydrolase family protein [Clostridia bacterium]